MNMHARASGLQLLAYAVPLALLVHVPSINSRGVGRVHVQVSVAAAPVTRLPNAPAQHRPAPAPPFSAAPATTSRAPAPSPEFISPITAPELTKIYLRRDGPGGRWMMEGEGPAWVEFSGGVAGLRLEVGGEFAVQYVNELDEPTIIHAHGLTPPQGMDGVPFVDAPPIEPGRTAVYV